VGPLAKARLFFGDIPPRTVETVELAVTGAKAAGSTSSQKVSLRRLEELCEGWLEAVGYELVDLELGRSPQGLVLRVFIDHVQSEPPRRGVEPRRINHGDCKRASLHIGTCLDVEDPISEGYSLEVSSPGVYRRLRRERDFARFAGFEVKVRMREPIEGRKSFTGTSRGVEGGALMLEEGDRVWVLPLESVGRAQLAEEY
jgi:ribosome maturation factor RimP